jgi:glycosyltransferase involved in cell wall biosynthesis
LTKPRVARIVSYLNVGGVEKRLLAVLKRLRGDFEVEVICIHSRGKLAHFFEEAGIPVTIIPFKSRLHPLSLYRLASYLRKRRVDIVHTHMYRPNVSGTVAARLAGVPVVVSNVHNMDHWDSKRQVWMDRALSPWRDRVITVSESVRRDYLERVRVAPERVKVVYNGVEVQGFFSNSAKEKIKKELDLSPSQKVIACIARLVPQKGHKFLLEGYRYVEEMRRDVILMVVGGGPLREYLGSYSEALGLKSVRFLGERADIPELLSITDVLVLPSLKEGFSNVVLESMAAAVPVIITDVGGGREIIDNEVNGFVVRPQNSISMGEIIRTLVARPETAVHMAGIGRERTEEFFSMDGMIQSTKQLYNRLLRSKVAKA